MNTFLELIHSRHSFRGEYQAVPVKREDLIKIMQAGIDAPSGCNKQTTSFIAIDDPHIFKTITQCYRSANRTKCTRCHLCPHSTYLCVP